MEENPKRRLRKRLRKSAGKLMEDSSARSHLDDGQADRLLKWGLGYVEAMGQETIDLPDAEAIPQLEKQVTAVRLIMQQINKLVGAAGKPVEKELLDEQLMRIFKNFTWLTGQTASFPQLQAAYTFQQQRLEADQALTFELLMNLIESYGQKDDGQA